MLEAFSQLIKKTAVMAWVGTIKLWHDPTELISRAIQPVLWLCVFGEAMSGVRAIPTEGFTYLQFITPGILTQSVTFVAIFYGLDIIMERDMGLLQKILVTPTPRLALVWGKMLSAGVRGISQAIVIFLLAMVLRIHLQITPYSLAGVLVLIVLGAGFFTGLSMIMASIVKTRERFMGIGQAITLPLFFASNAIYPIDIMPPWLRTIATINPLSYMVDGIRSLLVTGHLARLPGDIGVLAAAALAISWLSAYMYPKVVL
jgi:ABC-2 type transport system permease protein